MTEWINHTICGENLAILKQLPDNFIDLVYIDPPFFTQCDFKDFTDSWHNLTEYLEFMKVRIQELYRILKMTGTFYLHCDYHADGYLRTLCDQIFGYSNFQCVVYWHYTTGGASKSMFSIKTDTIFIYTKGNTWTFNYNAIKKPYNTTTLERLHRNGARTTNSETIAKIVSGEIGRTPDNVWDIPSIQGNSTEYYDYATQKPEILLNQIIKASSNEGDIILDCFCGSGTSVVVAKRLNRKYIGIDKNSNAIEICNNRLKSVIQYQTLSNLLKKEENP